VGAACLLPMRASADILVSHLITPGFSPEQGMFLIWVGDGQVQRVRAMFQPLPSSVSSDVQEAHADRWLAGALLPLNDTMGQLTYTLVTQGKSGQFHYVPPTTFSLSNQEPYFSSIDLTRARILQRRNELSLLTRELDQQKEELERLKADAGVIGNLRRIVDLQDRFKQVQSELASVDKYAFTLHLFIDLARAPEPPQGFVRRELQLTQQLSQIVQAGRLAEGGKLEVRFKAPIGADIRSELTLEDNVELAQMRAELESLRANGKVLESTSPQKPE